MALVTGRLSGGLITTGVLVLAAGLLGYTGRSTVEGECRPLNGADVCTWGEMTGGTLTAFGATIPIAAIDSAPDEAPMDWPPKQAANVPLPDAVRSATGFDHLGINWEPHGHPPGPYLVPHFDFHFYNITSAAVEAIDCADTTKPAELPAGYQLPDVTIPDLGTLVGLCVPQMGMHALPASELNSTTTFEKTMVVGYDHQRPIFIEPMITRATLDGRAGFSLDVPRVPGAPATLHYPQSFRAEYDSTAHTYRFVFSGFTTGGGS